MDEERKQFKNVVHVSNFLVGIIIAVIYLALILLVPLQVAKSKIAVTSPRVYPYIVFGTTTALAVFFAFAYRKVRYEINFGIWPLVLGTFIFYFGMKSIGFYITSFIMVLYNAYFWKYKNKKLIIIVALALPVFCYLFFTAFMSIQLPLGSIFGF